MRDRSVRHLRIAKAVSNQIASEDLAINGRGVETLFPALTLCLARLMPSHCKFLELRYMLVLCDLPDHCVTTHEIQGTQ